MTTNKPGSNRQPSKNAARKHHRQKEDSNLNLREERAKSSPQRRASDESAARAGARKHA